ncbi:Pentatricopeptide repeat-containing protein, chloroplastic [Capsicum chinense]|nr:Pentatricopeptide repeat-containing protein, chloroplastic [Capsicum chinense]
MYINFYIFEVDDTKEDYLSKLPDDVLGSILGNLTVRDAARTTTLSTRWKYLFASTQLQQQPTFRFRCSNMLGFRRFAHSHCYYNQEKDKFMNGLYQFLRLYSGRRVDFIELRCCFVREYPSAFTHWFQSLSRISVQSLDLSFECYPYSSRKLLKFSLEALSHSLEHLILSRCVVLSSPRVRFNSLTTLALRSVVLTSGHLEGILSSCSNLKKLNIEFSELPSKLQLTGTVIDVVILECDGGKEIDLHAAYLRTLECKIRNDVTFFFKFAPMLENVMVCRCFGRLKNSYIFGDHARDLPSRVKSLTLEFFPDQDDFPIANPTEMKTFRKLTNLRLIPVTSHGILQIFELSRLLGDFPLLQSLTFAVFKVASLMERTRSRRPPPSLKGHNRLKEVIYYGFDGSEIEMEFVVYVLKCAIVLEQVFLSPRVLSYFSCGPHPKANASFSEEKRNSIQQKLHGQALSSKARCYGKAGWRDDVIRTFDRLSDLRLSAHEQFTGCLLNVLTQTAKENLHKLTICRERANPKLGYVVKLLVDEKKAHCNCLSDICVNLNQLERACELLDVGLTLNIYKDFMSQNATQWSLHLKSLSLGAALTALHIWMNDLNKALESGEEFPSLLGINTGHGKHKYSEKGLAGVIESHLKELNAPFHEAPDHAGWLLTTKVAATSWLESRRAQVVAS